MGLPNPSSRQQVGWGTPELPSLSSALAADTALGNQGVEGVLEMGLRNAWMGCVYEGGVRP